MEEQPETQKAVMVDLQRGAGEQRHLQMKGTVGPVLQARRAPLYWESLNYSVEPLNAKAFN